MKIKNILFLFLLILMGCSGNEEQWIGPPGDLKYYKNKVYEKNYRVLYSGKYNERLVSYIEQGTVEDGNKTGKFIHLYPDGSVSMEGFYNGLGTRHGYFTYYYKTGEIEMEGLYEHGLKQGMWGLFYKNGQKKGQRIFIDGVSQ